MKTDKKLFYKISFCIGIYCDYKVISENLYFTR